MDNILYRFEIKKGKESVAEEWLEYLVSHKEEAEPLLKQEKAYFEAYFKETVEDIMYVYMFFSCDDVEYSNKTALESNNELNTKHFEYMKECVALDKGNIMESILYLNNMEDVLK
ncbi:MAG: DUF6176 family protein [Tissierellia bacterium]|nr:DUF6176 family protein [Tissierellia bacterium]